MSHQESYLLKTYKRLPLEMDRAQGVYVWDTAGRRYLDLYAGHAVASTGHCHPHVVRAIQDQTSKLIFYSNVAGLELREKAARQLIERAPGFSQALFANSGAEAIENALKLARRSTGRAEIIAMRDGFHGRTAGAMSVTGNEKYRKLSLPLLPDVTFIPFDSIEEARHAVTSKTAAVLLEPIQSMAGVNVAHPEFLMELRRLCTLHGALLIYDEVQTGIGRTGTMFFAGRYGVTPDLVCLAKGMASGIPLSAVLVPSPIAETTDYGEYGSTFGAGPIAMAALSATLDVIEQEHLLDNVARTSADLVERLKNISGVTEIRGMGFLLGFVTEKPAADLQRVLLEKGMIVGTSDHPYVVRLLPPLILNSSHVDDFIGVLGAALH